MLPYLIKWLKCNADINYTNNLVLCCAFMFIIPGCNVYIILEVQYLW